jgi:hypothetical protein
MFLNGNPLWRSDNDGAGSGLDADLLDGQQGSWYADIAGAWAMPRSTGRHGTGQQRQCEQDGWHGSKLLTAMTTGNFRAGLWRGRC